MMLITNSRIKKNRIKVNGSDLITLCHCSFGVVSLGLKKSNGLFFSRKLTSYGLRTAKIF